MDESYNAVLQRLYEQLPMYQRVGAAAYKADLSNTLALCALIGNPEKSLKFVHLAGTNGKGSTSHLIASVLQEAGYQTGLYTSPHLKDFRERIRMNGEMIPKAEVVSFVEQYESAWEAIKPSFFEITVAMAYWYFAKMSVDIVVLEAGMGGRLDSTNVVTPELSIITNIGMDHQQFLGATIEAISLEKAGIIKPGIPLVLGHMRAEAEKVIRKVAEDQKVDCHRADLQLNVPESALLGSYQRQNERTAYSAMMVLQSRGWVITDEQIKKGFQNVVKNTSLMGRWQVLSEKPKTIADCGHNQDGWRQILIELRKQSYRKLHIVLGMVGDKEVKHILAMLPTQALYYFTRANIPRSLDQDSLKEQAAAFNLEGEAFSSVKKAYEAARIYAEDDDLIFIGGSFFVVAEVL